MVEHARNLYRAFQAQGHKGTCNTCHCVRTCIAHVADLSNECFNCCVKRLVKEEDAQKAQKEHEDKCNIFMKDFAKL
ncbi:MAG: hypothetical protein IKS71_00695 [Bacteroidales bacterium]|nr:hypothetical protein [Bacteroidales bacterium]